MTTLCLCGSQGQAADCCLPYLDGRDVPDTPLALMRSRYVAFCMRDIAYVKKTWHPETCPQDLTLDEPHQWIALDIIEWSMDEEETEGEVEFVAKLILGDQLETLHELSQFEKINGRWLYHSGDFRNESARLRKISMKEPCPCGSSTKFKHCHYRR